MPKEYTLTVTPEEADRIGEALGKLPLEQVASLFMKLKVQVALQQQAEAAALAAEKMAQAAEAKAAALALAEGGPSQPASADIASQVHHSPASESDSRQPSDLN